MIPQIILGGKMCKVIYHTPQHKIDKAMDIMKDALADKFGFCYKSVQRIPLHTGRELRAEYLKLKLERMNPNLHKDSTQLSVIVDRMAEIRVEERNHYLYDDTAYKQLKSNYNKLKRALQLLLDEGEINKYTLTPSGMLKVTWFSEHHHIDVTYEIDQHVPIYCDADLSVCPASTCHSDLGDKPDTRKPKYNPQRVNANQDTGLNRNTRIKSDTSVSVYPGDGSMDRWFYNPCEEIPHPTYEEYFKED